VFARAAVGRASGEGWPEDAEGMSTLVFAIGS
jgi:hypothetical protein